MRLPEEVLREVRSYLANEIDVDQLHERLFARDLALPMNTPVEERADEVWHALADKIEGYIDEAALRETLEQLAREASVVAEQRIAALLVGPITAAYEQRGDLVLAAGAGRLASLAASGIVQLSAPVAGEAWLRRALSVLRPHGQFPTIMFRLERPMPRPSRRSADRRQAGIPRVVEREWSTAR